MPQARSLVFLLKFYISASISTNLYNIDFENDSILIGHTVTETRVDGHLQMIQKDLTKNNSSFRSLPLVAPIKELLNEKRKSIGLTLILKLWSGII